MTNEQLTQKFNPANAENMTPEDLEIMRNLSDDEIDILAKAYPNTPQRRSYLRLYDTKLAADKQLYQLSTWQNLRNVRKFANQKNLRPFDFMLRGNKTQVPRASGIVKTMPTGSKKVVVDLTATQAAEELKNSLKVDKKPAAENKPPVPKAVKPAAGKAEKVVKAAPVVVEEGVDKSDTPADQNFGSGD